MTREYHLVSAACRKGYSYLGNTWCVSLLAIPYLNWEQARLECEKHAGHLVVIESTSKQELVKEYIMTMKDQLGK